MERARQGRRTLIGALVAVALVGGVSAGAWAITRGTGAGAVTCENTTVSEGTVATYGRGLASAVGTEFATAHDIASYGADFWGQDYDGERPVDALATAVESALAADCALTLVADDLDVDTASFEAAAAEVGGVDAYERICSRAEELKDAVRTALLKQSPPTDDELRAAFAALGDTYKESDLAVTVLRVQGAAELLAAKTIDLTDLRSRLLADGAAVAELRIDSQEISKEDLYSSQVLDAMQHAAPGDVLDGFAEGEHLVLVDKLGGGLLTFEQAPQLARNAYVNALLETRLSEALAADPLTASADIADLLVARLSAP